MPEVLDRAQAGQHQHRDLGLLRLLNCGSDEVELVDLGEAVVEARPAEAIAVAHLDHLDTGPVQGRDNPADLLLGELVLHRV